MARQKCIASAPGNDNVYELLTVGEETQRDLEEAEDTAAKTPEAIAVAKEIEATLLLARAVDLTFLDGHCITFRTLFNAGITTGVTGIDIPVASDDRATFDIFFRNQVKVRL